MSGEKPQADSAVAQAWVRVRCVAVNPSAYCSRKPAILSHESTARDGKGGGIEASTYNKPATDNNAFECGDTHLEVAVHRDLF